MVLKKKKEAKQPIRAVKNKNINNEETAEKDKKRKVIKEFEAQFDNQVQSQPVQ